jgi:hypothetical protein
VCRGPAAARDDVRHAGRHQLFVLLPPPPGRARQRVSDTHTVKELAEDSIVHRPARECLDPRRRTRTDGRTDGPHLDRSPRLTAPAGRALHALGCLANWDAQGKLTYYTVWFRFAALARTACMPCGRSSRLAAARVSSVQDRRVLH